MTYERVYRIFGFGSIGFVVLVFSVALSRSMGFVGLILPSLCIAVAYLSIECVLDLLILWLDARQRPRRRGRPDSR